MILSFGKIKLEILNRVVDPHIQGAKYKAQTDGNLVFEQIELAVTHYQDPQNRVKALSSPQPLGAHKRTVFITFEHPLLEKGITALDADS